MSRFIAFKAQPGKPISPAKEVSDDREWLTPPALLELKSDLLVYTDSQLKNLALVADSRRFNRPDILVHFVNAGQATLSDLHTVTELSTTLRPIEGTFVLPVNSSPVPAENLHKLSMQPAGSAVQPADSSANQPAETTVLDVNLDDSLLEPLVNKLLHNSTTGQYDEPQSDVKTEGT